MRKNTKCVVAKVLALTLALTTVAAAPANGADAAKKPALSKKKVTVTVKQSKKITIKNVKAKKVKKLTVKIDKKKIASVKKNGKTAFTITGKKAGKATVTASIKVGKKTTPLKVKVTVKKADEKNETAAPSASPAASATVSAAPTTAASEAPTKQPKPTVRPVATDGEGSQVEARPEGTPLVSETWNFDDGVPEEWFARCNPDDNQVEVLSTDEAKSGKAMLVTGRKKGWNGVGLDMSAIGTLGATYRVQFSAKVADSFAEDLDGEEVNLRVSGGYRVTSADDETYENYPADTDYKLSTDEWRDFDITFVAPSSFYSYVFYFETNAYGSVDLIFDDITLTRTVAPAEADFSLASLKDTYAEYFDIFGVASTYSELMNDNSLAFIKHHFNSVTMGNSMKVDALVSNSETLKQSEANYILSDAYSTYAENKDADGNVIVPKFTLDEIDKVLKICYENGLKIRIHAPMWHQQMPKAFFCEQYDDEKAVITDKDVILAREEMFIRNVYQYILTSPYAEVVAAFDVVNEYTHMDNISAQVGSDNWWRYSFGEEMKTDCEYVKKAFVWAHEVLELCERTDISLMYNDYNTYQTKITDQIIELINNINKVDDINTVGKICDGVGMQCHFNDQHATVENFKTALSKFAAQGYEIQITELDITSIGVVNDSTDAETKAEVEAASAEMYAGIMTAILDAKAAGANIKSVTLWGTTDAGSWREDRSPLLFGTDISDKKPAFDAVINAALNYGK